MALPSVAQQLLGEAPETSGAALAESVFVSGQRFTQALRFTTVEPAARRSDSQAVWKSTLPVEASSRLRLSFWVRKIAPEDRFNIRASVRVETASGTPLLDTVFPINTPAWTFYAFDLVAAQDYGAGELVVRFQHGQGPQTYEIGGLEFQRQAPLPPLSVEGERVSIVGDWSRSSSYFDSTSGGGSARLVPVEGQSFSQAMRITTNGPSAEIFRAALSWRVDRAFTRGDVMHVSFWARRVGGELSAIQSQVVLERAGGNFSKSLSLRLPLEGDRWQRIQVPFEMDDTYAPGGTNFIFQFGAGPQIFEIADVVLRHFGRSATLAQLPVEILNPSAAAPNAAWRLAAAESIEANRKAPVRVKVVSASGDPLAGASVWVQQLKHAFRYGSAITAAGVMGNSADDIQYKSRIESHFTTTVLENDLKWPFWEASTSFPQARTRNAIAWLEERKIPVRGHVLLWGGWRNLPSDLPNLSADALRTRIEGRITNALTDAGLAGKLYHWDVQNEPFDNFDLQGRIEGVAGVTGSTGVLGNAEPLRWFAQARALAPGVKLYLNDYDQFESGTTNGTHLNYTFAYLQFLRDQNIAMDGFGFQSHFGNPVSLDLVDTVVQRYAKEFSFEFAVTEFDVNTQDEKNQALFTRDFMTYIFGQPRFQDFLMWGFWERRHWLPRGAMYRADWSSKPNAIESNNLLFREWWSDVQGETGEDGTFSARVFKGAYQVTVKRGDFTRSVIVDWPEGGELSVEVP